MVKCRKKIALLLVFVLIVTISMNLVSFAHFAIENAKAMTKPMTTDFTAVPSDPNVIEVNNFDNFVSATISSKFNDSAIVSDKRMTVRLASDIVLAYDFTLTADVNIDLNGYGLYTNGNKLGINHFYSGVFNIYNGKIAGVGKGETLRISTPNAYIAIETVIFDNITVEIMEANSDRIFDGAELIIADAIAGGKRALSLDDEARLNRNRYCALHDIVADDHNCRYVCNDIDLPKNLYASGAVITYISSNSDVVSASGKVNNSGLTGFVNINLQAIITYNSQSRSVNYILHVYDPNSAAADTAAVIEAIEELEIYYYKGDSVNTGIVELYNITEPLLVSRYSFGNGKELVYETLDAAEVVIDSSKLLKGDNFAKPPTAAESGYVMTLTDDVKKLKIGTVSGDFWQVINVNGQNSQAINDNYAAAIKIARELYGDEIVITERVRDEELGNADGKTYVNGFSSKVLTYNTTEYANKYGVQTIDYALLNNADATYEIDSAGRLQIKNANYAPNELQKVTLKMRFEFKTEPITVSVNIPIRYDPQNEGDGNNIAKFLPYYNYFDRLLLSLTGGRTFEDFEMPFGYGMDGAVYYYEVYNTDGTANTDLLDIKLKYFANQAEVILTREETAALSGAEIQEIMLSGSAKWQIKFNREKLPVYDSIVKLRYRYKFFDYTSEWYGNDANLYESELNVKGVIKASDMPDAELYKYIYDCTRPNKYSPEYVADSNMMIVTSWLDNAFRNGAKVNAVDLSGGKINDAAAINSHGKSVTSIKGLEYVKNLESLNLASSGIVKNSDIDIIRRITGLKSLNLDNNGLYDRSTGTLGLPSGSNNNVLNKLQDLIRLEKLHLENNAFYYFTGLNGIPSLKEVCVYGNKHTSSWSAFTPILNTLYGTDGMVNRSLYGKLSSAGVIVRNVSENEGFSQLADNDVMEKLESIEYQRKLPIGLAIDKAYEGLSRNPRDYGIENMGNTPWLGSQKDDAIEFVPVGEATTATKFIIRYKYYYQYLFQSQEIVLEAEMDVIRY